MKPRIWFKDGEWHCSLNGIGKAGTCVTPATAYTQWATNNGLWLPMPKDCAKEAMARCWSILKAAGF